MKEALATAHRRYVGLGALALRFAQAGEERMTEHAGSTTNKPFFNSFLLIHL